jgi:hypothetical protein
MSIIVIVILIYRRHKPIHLDVSSLVLCTSIYLQMLTNITKYYQPENTATLRIFEPRTSE